MGEPLATGLVLRCFTIESIRYLLQRNFWAGERLCRAGAHLTVYAGVIQDFFWICQWPSWLGLRLHRVCLYEYFVPSDLI